MKIISFCLFGQNPKYTVGAIRNAELALKWYPGWSCWYFMSADEASSGIVKELLDVGRHVGIMFVHNPPDWRLMIQRFKAIDSSDVEVALFRDTDSRLSLREKAAVDEFLASDKAALILRDHPWHTTEILGGGWGLKRDRIPNFGRLLESWPAEDRYQTDQEFLRQKIWPLIKNDSLIFDEFYAHRWGGKPFPSKRNGYEFFGQVFDENEKTVDEHTQILKKYIR